MLKLRFKNNKHNAVWLVEPKVTIGKAAKNDLVVDDADVAEFHAEILVDHEQLTLKVVDAASPVSVNGTQVTSEQPLSVNDVLVVGRAQLQVVDPKQEPKAAPTLVRAEATGWSLKANHPALSSKVFNLGVNTVVGRANDCDIVLAAAHLSRRHAQLTVKDGLLYVKDLGSANGTFVNGSQVNEARVKRGDELRFDTLSFGVMGPADDLDKTTVREMPKKVAGQKPAAAAANKAPRKPDLKFREELKASMASSAEPQVEDKPRSSAFTGLSVLVLVLAGVGYWAWQQGWF
ncbi:FHA domain-containing protein [Simiduia agarivorans]|uniref:FHA domain-containing protein n=1 Tax=Simiduia agarivorans (strain DSM 21679 / JCM 13881 / BCRC 17597 / SA1) TaxID=1117647 RepID=K4KHK6_SIMAS|nr:FHA domain-containing protein [Simiduia agarivorans]AFU97448.1 FHA domain-containing protein [Simiduia agarivorans SA1 = DSM 21679]